MNPSQTANNPPCCLCAGKRFRTLVSAPAFDDAGERFRLAECQDCHLVRTEPVLDHSELGKYYSSTYYGSGTSKFTGPVEWLTYCANYLRARSLLSHLGSHGRPAISTAPRVLDVGCGRAHLLRIMRRMGCECYGIERTEFPIDDSFQGIRFYKENIEKISFDDAFFDLVVMWHVLEHVPDPVLTTREVARILRPGGLFAVAVPNLGSLQFRLFRGDWFHLDLPRHIHHFNLDTLSQCLNRNGFKFISVTTASLEQNPYGFVQSLLNKAVPFAQPNSLYALLRKHEGWRATMRLLAWLAAAACASPLALLEYVISGLSGTGASAIVYAQRIKPR